LEIAVQSYAHFLNWQIFLQLFFEKSEFFCFIRPTITIYRHFLVVQNFDNEKKLENYYIFATKRGSFIN